MKTFRINNLIAIAAFLIIVSALDSCKTEKINEVKVPDFATLSSQFNQPPAEYTTAPFFVWNARYNKGRD